MRFIFVFASTLLFAMSYAASTDVPPPPNEAASVTAEGNRVRLAYNGRMILDGRLFLETPGRSRRALPVSAQAAKRVPAVSLSNEKTTGNQGALTQVLTLKTLSPLGEGRLTLEASFMGSEQAFPAETLSSAQDRFKYVRNSVGLSRNLRNNAIYDRKSDIEFEGPGETATRIVPVSTGKQSTKFSFEVSSTTGSLQLTFRPRYYQKHKNIAYFQPWNYSVWKGSVTGWCSWWAYFDSVTEKDVEALSAVFADKLKDYGYKYVQIDDGYQSGSGGLPKDTLNTNPKFPNGLQHLSLVLANQGLAPGIWVNVHFGDEDFVAQHPDWFMHGANGKPRKGPWIDYGMDGSVKGVLDTIVHPLYRQLHNEGWTYVKIDTLRHLLYDDTYNCREWFASKGIKGEDAFRAILSAARRDLGRDTYMLACWGVLPEAVGIVDGCRLGGDGFGPNTLQQYTSWNNVVWRNDPDHCDIKPLDRKTGRAIDGEERIRPVLVAMAGAQLLLSDKPEVYKNEANLEGARRSSPILFTLPGQLYDYDPSKTDNLIKGLRNDQGGAQAGPIDATQQGEVCPWWMQEINTPFENWSVLTRLNWHDSPMAAERVSFADLGLPDEEYCVYEFWSRRYLGAFRGGFAADGLTAKGVATYAIRRMLDHPQVLSTSRHVSQGGVDLMSVRWSSDVLEGESKVVRGDPYRIVVRVPAGYRPATAESEGRPLETDQKGEVLTVTIKAQRTQSVAWTVRFTR